MPEGTINGEPYVVPKGWIPVDENYHYKAISALSLLQDLDRSPAGRHESDPESQDPTGFSQGNPFLKEGDVIGFHISGQRIIVPAPEKLGDPAAWIEERK